MPFQSVQCHYCTLYSIPVHKTLLQLARLAKFIEGENYVRSIFEWSLYLSPTPPHTTPPHSHHSYSLLLTGSHHSPLPFVITPLTPLHTTPPSPHYSSLLPLTTSPHYILPSLLPSLLSSQHLLASPPSSPLPSSPHLRLTPTPGPSSSPPLLKDTS